MSAGLAPAPAPPAGPADQGTSGDPADPAGASDPPPGRLLWRRFRWPTLLAAAVIAVAVAGVLAQAGGNSRTLDPDGVSKQGSRALATLLREGGVPVQRVPTAAAAATASRAGGATIFVPEPARIPPRELHRLPATARARLVLIAPEPPTLAALAPEVAPAGSAPVRRRQPNCAAPAARLAGSAELGGQAYTLRGSPTGRATVGCYPAGDGVSLVLDAAAGRVTVIGTSKPFTNAALDDAGNAALALSLLGSSRVVWLLPRPGEVPAAAAGEQGLLDLLPDRLLLAVAQGAVAVALLALWRARRLGGVVTEPLPVLVRGTETTEGRARLYRATSARRSAAGALRIGTRRRVAARVGLSPDPQPEALTAAVCARTARPPASVRDLLYGADPADHAALVRLANDLDILAAEVGRT